MRRRRHPVAVGLLAITVLVACGGESSSCELTEVAEREPDVLAELPESAQDSMRDAYLLHEQDGYAFYLGTPVEDDRTEVCLTIIRGDELLSAASSVSWVDSMVDTRVRASYDTAGDVAAVAEGLDNVDECLAVRTA